MFFQKWTSVWEGSQMLWTNERLRVEGWQLRVSPYQKRAAGYAEPPGWADSDRGPMPRREGRSLQHYHYSRHHLAPIVPWV